MKKYYMDYIEDKDVYKAVMFARKLKHEGMDMGLAIYKSARYYGVNQQDVAHYMGQLGGNVNSAKYR